MRELNKKNGFQKQVAEIETVPDPTLQSPVSRLSYTNET